MNLGYCFIFQLIVTNNKSKSLYVYLTAAPIASRGSIIKKYGREEKYPKTISRPKRSFTQRLSGSLAKDKKAYYFI